MSVYQYAPSTRSIAVSAVPAQSYIIERSSPAQSAYLVEQALPAESYLIERPPSSPAQAILVEEAVPTQTYLIEQAPAQSIAVAASPARSIALSAAPARSLSVSANSRWADYSPEQVVLPEPVLPEPDYKCYAPPQVPPGQTRYLKVDEPTTVKNLAQNFNDVRTAVRENNTHVQRNKTIVTNIARNHNHLLRIITNENNFEHNLTNNLVRVADIHRQKIENLKGETRNFKDFKATQKVEAAGCSRADAVQVVSAPADNCARQSPQIIAATPALSRRSSRQATYSLAQSAAAAAATAQLSQTLSRASRTRTLRSASLQPAF